MGPIRTFDIGRDGRSEYPQFRTDMPPQMASQITPEAFERAVGKVNSVLQRQYTYDSKRHMALKLAHALLPIPTPHHNTRRLQQALDGANAELQQAGCTLRIESPLQTGFLVLRFSSCV